MDMASKRLIIALDDIAREDVGTIVKEASPFGGTFKVGLALFVAHGPAIIKEIKELGAEVFLDLKLHDIPMQVAKSVEKALQYQPRFLTVHAQGGRKMLSEVAAVTRGSSTKVLAVSVLTSLGDKDFCELGYSGSIEHGVLTLADLAYSSGVSGLVSSPHELKVLRKRFGRDLFLVCPGVRPQEDALHDQSRVMTPYDAIAHGADALVVGRPITEAHNIGQKARLINEEIMRALSASSAMEHAL